MDRKSYLTEIVTSLETFPVVALLGARQVGKTTLARQVFSQSKATKRENYFDLEDARDQIRLQDPLLALEELSGLVVIDEFQRLPEIFTTLRVLVDRAPQRAQFLILGSASRELIQQTAESLTGRIKFIQINPFDISETGADYLDKLWLCGGYPRAWLAKNEAEAFDWLQQYISTFLERDLPQLGFNLPALTMRRFWMMLAHYHGQIVNYAEIARSLDLSESTIRRYLDILVGTFMVRRLSPWHANIDKRQIKSPKIYFRDSGLFHCLLNISNREQLNVSPNLGASWEGFALEQYIQLQRINDHQIAFWGVHQQAEIDLVISEQGALRGVEFKYTMKPSITKSILKAIELLKLQRVTIVYPGKIEIALAKNIRAIPLIQINDKM